MLFLSSSLLISKGEGERNPTRNSARGELNALNPVSLIPDVPLPNAPDLLAPIN